MIEKRFALEYDGNCYKCIVDCNNGTLYTDRKQIVEVLNKLHEENIHSKRLLRVADEIIRHNAPLGIVEEWIKEMEEKE